MPSEIGLPLNLTEFSDRLLFMFPQLKIYPLIELLDPNWLTGFRLTLSFRILPATSHGKVQQDMQSPPEGNHGQCTQESQDPGTRRHYIQVYLLFLCA